MPVIEGKIDPMFFEPHRVIISRDLHDFEISDTDFVNRSQVWHVLTRRLAPHLRRDVCVVGTRMEARARIRWTFWHGGDAFHDWATGLLAYLEEYLDMGYYVQTRASRLVVDIDQKLGYMQPGSLSVVESLARIESALRDLSTRLEGPGAGDDPAATGD